MRALVAACALLVAGATVLPAQQPTPQDTSKKKLPADTTIAADSAALEAEMAKLAGRQNAGGQSQASPSNPRLLPDFSAVGDLIADLTPEHSTQEDGSRFGVREVEIAIQAAVDPYFRGDIFLGVSDPEGIAIEEAWLTTTSLPASLEARLGRYRMPFGKINLTHRHDLHTVEYPWVIQRLFGPEGLKGTGVWLSKIISPFGFYQELQVTAVDLFDEAAEDLIPFRPFSDQFGDIGFTARLRNYWDLSESKNIELSASALTGRRLQPIFPTVEATPCVVPLDVDDPTICVNAVAARQSVIGADLTYRWRPLEKGLYKSFILQAEIMKQFNDDDPDLPFQLSGFDFAGSTRDIVGAYIFGRYQIAQRAYLGARFDWVQDAFIEGESLTAGQAVFEFFPSEFSKLLASFEHVAPGGGLESESRFLFQATFALGPHKPHPF